MLLKASYPIGVSKEVVDAWCLEHFGEPDILHGRWFPLTWSVRFRNDKDRNWFLLRWS